MAIAYNYLSTKIQRKYLAITFFTILRSDTYLSPFLIRPFGAPSPRGKGFGSANK